LRAELAERDAAAELAGPRTARAAALAVAAETAARPTAEHQAREARLADWDHW
jgi:hypothetical protein